MWIILKFDKKRLNFLLNDFKKVWRKNIKFTTPKICLEYFKKNKAFKKEVNLLGDYLLLS